MEEDTCMSYEKDDTCMPYEEEDTYLLPEVVRPDHVARGLSVVDCLI
jgi:hypothetical protein